MSLFTALAWCYLKKGLFKIFVLDFIYYSGADPGV
jgi:hypothetical protein